MKLTIYIDKDLTPRWNEFPKEPSKPGPMSHQEFFREYYEDDLPEYSVALQKAKEEAIPFEDLEDIWDLIEPSLRYIRERIAKERQVSESQIASYGVYKDQLKDSFVTIDYDGTVEVVNSMSDGWVPTYNNPDNSGCEQPAEPIKVARLLPSKPKEVSPEVPDKGEEKPDFQKLEELGLSPDIDSNGVHRYTRSQVIYALEKIWADYCDPKDKELRKTRDWLASAKAIVANWNAVDKLIRNHPDTKIGESVSTKAIEMFKKFSLYEELKQHKDE